MSILLSASIGRDSATVRVLLQAGADPQEQVKLVYQSNQEWRTATFWMLFLFFFATSVLDKGGWEDIDLCSPLLEEYLKFGVDTDIFFLLDQETVIFENQLERRSRGEDSEEESEQREHELVSISLEGLIRLGQPKNVDALQTLLLDKAKRPLWSKTSSAISKFLLWTVPSTPITSGYKAFEFKELGVRKFKLHSVCSKTSQIEKGFRVPIC